MTKRTALALAREKFGPEADAFPETYYLGSLAVRRQCTITDGLPRKGANRFSGPTWLDAAIAAGLSEPTP